jgi:uncharacterized membrane protein
VAQMSATRKYYILSAAIFAIGAVLAVVKAQPVALGIFAGLFLMMLWIQSRVDRIVEERYPSDRESSGD